MTYWFTVAARWLHGVGLGLWLGGVIGVGALAAPAAFHVTRGHGAFAGNLALQNDVAGAIVGEAFRHFNILCLVCGALMLLANVVIAGAAKDRRARRLTLVSTFATVILTGLAVYLQYGLFPVIDAAKAQQQWSLFDRLHHLYVSLTNVQLPLLLLAAWVVAQRDTSRTLPVSSDPSH